jgi:HSP20 family protein
MNLLPFRRASSLTSSWDPYREMEEFQNRFAQLFTRGWSGTEGMPWIPAMDVFEDDKTVKLSLEIPGMEKKDIDVSLDDGVLVVRGERKLEHEEKKDGYAQIERRFGSFERRFLLPAYVDQASVNATCKEGILEIVLKKTPQAKAKPKPVTVQ